MPTVSVLLPIYNGFPDLSRAICSLQNQTYKDFEIIAIDDGSTDGSGELLDKFAKSDTRIRAFHQENAGSLGKVLNNAAKLATGEYLARQDADDASAPTRLEDQVNYLQNHPRIGLCGAWTWFIDAELGPLFSLELPDNQNILSRFLYSGKNPFVHGSIMLHSDIYHKTGGYRGSYAQDFDLWLRVSELTNIGMCTTLGYYFWRSVGGITTGAHLRQQASNSLALKLHSERIRFGHELSNWETEYQKIMNLSGSESTPLERQSSIHYARGLQLLRRGMYDSARGEWEMAASGQGHYARKAHRNLSFFRFAPLLTMLYKILESQEPERYARKLSAETALPDF